MIHIGGELSGELSRIVLFSRVILGLSFFSKLSMSLEFSGIFCTQTEGFEPGYSTNFTNKFEKPDFCSTILPELWNSSMTGYVRKCHFISPCFSVSHACVRLTL